jgi:hypothetical protein
LDVAVADRLDAERRTPRNPQFAPWHIPTSSTWKIKARSTPRERAKVMTEVSMTIRATESRGRAGTVTGVIAWRASTAANLAEPDSDVRRSSLWED